MAAGTNAAQPPGPMAVRWWIGPGPLCGLRRGGSTARRRYLLRRYSFGEWYTVVTSAGFCDKRVGDTE
ncbi:hypothetical protein BPY_19290 [Bifidobacterium psychraerophilum]